MKTVRAWLIASGYSLAAMGVLIPSSPAALAANVTSTWTAAASGTWNAGANWTNAPALGSFPNNGNGGVATYDAAISAAGSAYTVTLNTNVTLEDLSLNSADATLTHTLGTLTATGAINLAAGTYNLAGGTIANSTVNAAVPITLTGAGGTLSAVTVAGDLSFPIFNSKVVIAEGTTFTTAHLAGGYSTVGFAPAQTLSGTIQFEGAGDSSVTMGSAGTLTVGASGVIKTSAGLNSDVSIGSGGFAYNAAMALVNNGLISSQVSGRTLTINAATSFANGATGTLETKSGGVLTIAPPAAWTNAGTISVNAGTLNLGGTFNATGGIGTWSNTGGTVNVTGTVNAGSGANTLTLSNATGSWSIAGGTMGGGTLAFTGGKTLNLTGSGGTLSGVTVAGDLNFPAFNSKVLIAGGTTFTTAHLGGSYSAIGFAPAQTLSGTIQFEGTGGQSSASLGSAGTFTVGASGVIKTAAGLDGDVSIGSGGFAYNAAMALVNNGLISSQVSGRTLTINAATSFANGATGTLETKSGGVLTIAPPAAWTNAGTISLNSGTVNLGGTFSTTGGIGTWTNTGGTVNVTGAISNAGNTLTLNSGTGSWNLAGGTINGGTLGFANGQTLNATGAGGTLSGVTVSGDLSFPVFNSKALIAGGTTFTTAHLGGSYSAIGFAPAQTLSGTIQFEGTGGQSSASLGSAGTFTVGASGVIKTAAGLDGDVSIGSGGFAYNAAMALINNGLISSQVSGRKITVNPATSFTNAGVFEATSGGTLTVPFGYTQTAGVTRVSTGGTISLLDQAAMLKTITLAGGRLEGNGTITANVASSAMIAPGLSAGSLSINGDLTLAAGSTLQIEMGGVHQGVDYDLLSEGGVAPLNLAGASSVVRVGGFLPTASDSLIILSSNQPITGMFSNVVAGRVTATDGVTSLKVSVVGNYVVLGELPGDYDGSGVVDGGDILVWQRDLGGEFTPAHLDVWRTNLGKTAGSVASANRNGFREASSNVPEPGAAGLMLAGGCLLAAFRRAGRRARGVVSPSCFRGRHGISLGKPRLVVAILVGWSLAAGAASAQNTYWTNQILGNWFVGSNWSNGEPYIGFFTADVNAFIDNGGLALINAPGAGAGDLSVGRPLFGGGLSISGAGTLTQRGRASIGTTANLTASVTVNGSAARWDVVEAISVGGNGTLRIENGADVTSAAPAFLDFYPGGAPGGSVVVTGAGSTWTMNDAFTVGFTAPASLSISSGGAVSSSAGILGFGSGSTGTATITGIGSSWSNSGSLTVGRDGGAGVLRIYDRGVVQAASLRISNSSAVEVNNGQSNVAGLIISGVASNSNYASLGGLTVANTSNGRMVIQNGGTVANSFGTIGADSVAGSVLVQGPGSTWTNTDQVVAGLGGSGTLEVRGGGTLNSVRGFAGANANSSGIITKQAADPLLLDSAVLAQIQGASVLGRVATGPRAGQRVLRLGDDPAAPVVTSGGPRHAHFQGFDLHANVAVPAGERERLEHLCPYVGIVIVVVVV